MRFIHRELSWLDFNSRVLAEARKEENLPLDRLNFLAITASNLDEFFMVRVADLHDRRKDGNGPDDTGMTAYEQLEKVLERARSFQAEQNLCLIEILKKLEKERVSFLSIDRLSAEQKAYAKTLFEDEILPVVTPLAVDPSRPFPFLLNKSLNIGVRLRNGEGESVFAVVQVPSILPRFIPIPTGSQTSTGAFLPLEDLIAHYLPSVCDLYPIEAWGLFRITRSADIDADDDADDLMEEMKRTIKKRKRGKPIRLELSQGFDAELSRFLIEMLRVNRRYIFELDGLMDLASLGKIASKKEYRHLRREPMAPVPSAELSAYDDIFAAIRDRDRMVHHPYHSFDHVVDFIQAAAEDPLVLAIKQTLYRVSGRSQVIAALEQAAEMGKQVTVLVELKARFDEENNIQWANRLERAGCHVIYGLTGLKTHCKVTLVVRREPTGIRRYLHLSTGNYNDVTARLYTDIGMFTCRPAFGADASALFNHLTGFSNPPEYNKLIVAPEAMLRFFLEKIDQEIRNAKQKLPCGISIKVNSLLDGAIVRKLYEASQEGVPIHLLVRGICSLLPGKEYSATIRVRSIVGELLEHSRIFVFQNGGNPLVYMGSADLMPRNLYRRVEVMFPVEDERLKQQLLDTLELMWRDNTNAWEIDSDGVYRQVPRRGRPLSSQRELHRLAEEEYQRAQEQSTSPSK